MTSVFFIISLTPLHATYLLFSVPSTQPHVFPSHSFTIFFFFISCVYPFTPFPHHSPLLFLLLLHLNPLFSFPLLSLCSLSCPLIPLVIHNSSFSFPLLSLCSILPLSPSSYPFHFLFLLNLSLNSPTSTSASCLSLPYLALLFLQNPSSWTNPSLSLRVPYFNPLKFPLQSPLPPKPPFLSFPPPLPPPPFRAKPTPSPPLYASPQGRHRHE